MPINRIWDRVDSVNAVRLQVCNTASIGDSHNVHVLKIEKQLEHHPFHGDSE
jgi:hypothetical protein